MKSFFLTIFLALLSLTCFSQKSEMNYYYDWYMLDALYVPIQYYPSKDVKEIRFTQIKSEKEKKYVKKYNKDGHVSYYARIDEDGKEIPVYDFEFNDFGQVISSKAFKKGKLKHTITETYEANGGGRTSLEKVDSKGRLKLRNTWEYKSTDCLSSSVRYKGNGKAHRKWIYSYYEGCDKEKTELYNGEGKLLKTWSYACKEEGEILTKKKDTVQTCKWEESDGEYLLKIYQTLDEKGKVRKHIAKYTLTDTLIVERKTYDGDDNLLYESKYDKAYNKLTKYIFYRKGIKRSENNYTYDGNLLVVQEQYFKGKLRSKSTYQYQDSLLVKMKQLGKNGKETITLLEYPK